MLPQVQIQTLASYLCNICCVFVLNPPCIGASHLKAHPFSVQLLLHWGLQGCCSRSQLSRSDGRLHPGHVSSSSRATYGKTTSTHTKGQCTSCPLASCERLVFIWDSNGPVTANNLAKTGIQERRKPGNPRQTWQQSVFSTPESHNQDLHSVSRVSQRPKGPFMRTKKVQKGCVSFWTELEISVKCKYAGTNLPERTS